jgi:DHA2 family lincomycin resistance protein-like MFS transporter
MRAPAEAPTGSELGVSSHRTDPTQAQQVGGAPATGSHDRLQPGDGLVIGLLMASTFIVLLNEMMLAVALPTLIDDLDITASTGQWLTTGYLLTLAVLIPTTGFVMRRFHLRTVYLVSMSLFVVGTALAAVAPGFGVLFAGRIVQAVGTAVFLPLLITTTMRLVPAGRQSQVMAFVVVVTAAAPALGPAAAGLVLSQLSWRWLFILMLPIGLVGLATGAAKLRNISTPEPVRLDVLSLVLSAVGFGALVYGLASIGESVSGHTPVPPVAPLLVGLVGIIAFVVRQLRLQANEMQLLDMRVFAIGSFTLPFLMMFVLTMTAFGQGVIIPLLLSNVHGLSPLQIGFFIVPGGVTIAVVSAIGGRVLERVGARMLAVPGAVIVATSLLLFSRADSDTSVGSLLAIYILMFVGQALMWSPLTTIAMASLPPHLYPHGSAAFSTVQQLGGAAGTAILVSAYTLGSDTASTGTLRITESVSASQAAFATATAIACISVVGTLFVKDRRHHETTAEQHAAVVAA